jgi:hypothetical protein
MSLILPNTGRSYELPITIVDPRSMTIADEEMVIAMQEHPPQSRFKAGDLAYLSEVPAYLRNTRDLLPRVWQVRFVISTWAHEIMRLVHSEEYLMGIDHAHALLERQRLNPASYEKAVIYAHGFPHGMYPDSAAWFPERVLRKVVLRDTNQQWVQILDEAKAPFHGYDGANLLAPYTFDLAPDLYSKGENLGRPFSFEEATVHTAAELGLEEVLFRPVDPYYIQKKAIDPQHDIFKREV